MACANKLFVYDWYYGRDLWD